MVSEGGSGPAAVPAPADLPLVSPQALPYVCLLIAMLFFIYAIIGMQVGTLPRGGARVPIPWAEGQ